MSSRAAILARLRAQASAGPSAAAQPPYRPTPVDDLGARLLERAKTVLATGEAVASLADIPAAVARYLASHELAAEAAVAADLAGLSWAASGICVLDAPSRRSVPASVAFAPAAIAETGSLMLTSREAPWANLLADTHFAVVRRGDILPSLEEAVGRIGGNRLPRSLHVVTGPSRTGDIEQTLELGAHGAVRLHIFVAP
ncbi:MAG: LUD domain-containing protein [Alphaproteobacteria bacterium]|nr:LUD domain-containing protein [Alphaproteobacteria bacterium]